MVETVTPIEIFCSYAHEDEAWLRKLETHLSLLKRQGLISLWHDRLIVAGMNWAKNIDTHLETASVILLLVSANFLASDYCVGIEMKRALERQEAGEARVIPILVSPVDWTGAPFAHLQPLPTDAEPLASWRNKDAALADVAAGIRRVIVEDLPQLATSAPRAALPVIWNIPYPHNPFFLGRESELAQVRHHLQAGQAMALVQPQAISGLGGIGKTQLALEYAYRYRQDYQVVLWARAESIDALVSSYIAIATLLQLPEREAKEQDIIVQAVKIWLQTHRDWLLILDNADELTLLPDFLPPILGGHLLLTTRAAATGRLAHRLEIEVLPPEQGALFLLRRAKFIPPDADLSCASPQERKLAVQISEQLGGLPLALDQAGAYLEETGVDLAGYWHLYQQHWTDLLRQHRGLVADHPMPVATTWLLSFQKVEEKNVAAAELLRLCAFLSPDAITEEILTVGSSLLGPVLAPVAADALLLNQAIETLRAYSLVKRNPQRRTLTIHRLVQVVVKDELDGVQRKNWAERATLAVNAAFPKSEYGTWSQCERLLPHALLVAQYIETDKIIGEEAGHLLHKVATYLKDRAHYQQAKPLYQRALVIREQVVGSQHPDTATSLNDLAILYREQCEYEQAEPLYQRALTIREHVLGPLHPDTAATLDNLAGLYRKQKKYEQAEAFFLQALAIKELTLEPQHPYIASTLNNLALLYHEQEKYEQAEPLYRRALAIRERRLGPQHPYTTTTLQNYAFLLRRMRRSDEADILEHRLDTLQNRQSS
jgi:tetratricopeptide (TPR) repeat protein